jgi:hypothetical protein
MYAIAGFDDLDEYKCTLILNEDTDFFRFDKI